MYSLIGKQNCNREAFIYILLGALLYCFQFDCTFHRTSMNLE